MKKIFVAGNGPSLKEINFDNLKNIEWMGMNVAYRYWDTVNIYPTYYCCLDKVVVQDHAKEIVRLISEKKVKKAFLTKAILEIYPDLVLNEAVFFLEDCGNLENDESNIFKTKYSSKKTTGSWAIRFLISMGYKEIYISGIDCNYVEVVKGAVETGKGLELKIVDETQENPNYFFDFYQKKDDLYQIPNPESHFGNLHLQSLEAIAQDVELLNLDVKIFNTAKSSNLFTYNVFPYISPSKLFVAPKLEAVCVPMIKKELNVLLNNIELWDRVGFMPLTPGSMLEGKIHLHIIMDCDEESTIIEQINRKMSETLYLKKMFGSTRITFLDIPKELNVYERNVKKTDVFRKIGPNTHFFLSMHQFREYKHIFFMETDCTPTKQNWLADLNNFTENNEGFFIAGSFPSSYPDTLDPAISLHLNGNAIYATGNDKFQLFLKEVFFPSLEYLKLKKKDRHIAYDCVLSKIMAQGISQRIQKDLGNNIDEKVKVLYKELLKDFSKLISCPLISNYIPKNNQINYLEVDKMDAVIIHNRDYNDSIRDMLIKSNCELALDIDKNMQWYKNKFLNAHSLINKDNLYAYHYFSQNENLKFEFIDYSRNFILLSGRDNKKPKEVGQGANVLFDATDLRKGDMVQLSLKINISDDVFVDFQFARQGSGKFCANEQSIGLKKNVLNVVEMSLKLKDAYSGLRINIMPNDVFSMMTINYDIKTIDTNQTFTKKDISLKIIPVKKDAEYIIKKLLKVNSSLIPITTKTISNKKLPKVLILDMTLLGSNSATGQIKETLFENWDEDKIFQVYLHSNQYRGKYPKKSKSSIYIDGISEEIEKFSPEVIYYRMTNDKKLFNLYFDLQQEYRCKTITHIMDDWPKRIFRNDRTLFHQEYDKQIKKVLTSADINLSICDEMSKEYEKRYKVKFSAIANGVDINAFVSKNWSTRVKIDIKNPIVIRYMGGLENDMTTKTIIKLAKYISKISSKYNVKFEIYTMNWHLDNAKNLTKGLAGITVSSLVDKKDYPKLLSTSDMLVLGYNFDEKTLDYLSLSFANKLPEVLASGVPVLAIGHEKIPTIAYCSKLKFINTIDNEIDFNEENIKHILDDLYFKQYSVDKLNLISESSREHVEKFFAKENKKKLFESFFIENKIKKIDSQERQNYDLVSANKLYRDGKYLEAKNIYTHLYNTSNFYKFLKFNIVNCDKKISDE